MIYYQDESYTYEEQLRGVIQYIIDPNQFDKPIERQYEQFYTTELEARHDAKQLANKMRVSVEIDVADRWGMYGRDYLETITVHPDGSLSDLLGDISNDLRALGI